MENDAQVLSRPNKSLHPTNATAGAAAFAAELNTLYGNGMSKIKGILFE